MKAFNFPFKCTSARDSWKCITGAREEVRLLTYIWKLFNIEQYLKSREVHVGNRVRNMALALGNRNRNGIESDIRASEEHRKRAGKKTGKHFTVEVNEKRIFFLMGSQHYQMSKESK